MRMIQFFYGQTCQKKQGFILETGSVLNLLTKGDLSWPPCDYDYIPATSPTALDTPLFEWVQPEPGHCLT